MKLDKEAKQLIKLALRNLFLVMTIGFIFISLTSAFEFDNVKIYDALTKEVTFKDSILGIPTTTIAKAKLETPQINYVFPGKDKLVARFEIQLFDSKYDNALRDLQMIDLKTNKTLDRRFTYRYLKGVKEIVNEVPESKMVCEAISNKTSGKEDIVCHPEIVGITKVTNYEDEWGLLNESMKEALYKGNITIGIFIDVYPDDKVEWIPTLFGLQVTEWATWWGLQPTAYWKFENNLLDSSGNNYTMTPQPASNNTFNDTSYKLGNYARQYVGQTAPDCNLSSNLPVRAGNFSMGFWIRSTDTTATRYIASSGADDDGTEWVFREVSGNLNFREQNGAFSITIKAMAHIMNGLWQRVIIVREGTGTNLLKVYVNGTLVAQGTEARDFSEAVFCVGGLKNGGAFSPIMTLDDLFLFKGYAMNQSDITYDWNSGAGRTLDITSAVPIVTLNSPSSNYVTANGINTLNCSATFIPPTSSVNGTLILDDVMVYSPNFFCADTCSGLDLQYTTSDLSEGVHNWTCYAEDKTNGLNTTGIARTITIDKTAPSLRLNQNISNVTTLSLPINVSLNYTASDTRLSRCWYNTSESAINNLITCNSTAIVNFTTGGLKTIFYYANDSVGNLNLSSTSVYIYYLQPSATATNPITEGGLSSHSLTLAMSNITNWNVVAWLIWNNTNKGSAIQTNLSANSMRFDISFIVPSFNGSLNITPWTWYYNISGNPNITAYSISGNQTLVPLALSECGAGMQQVINYTMYDEKTRLISDGANATIEVDLTLTSYENTSLSWNFHGKKQDSASYAICLPNGALNNSAYRMDSVCKYDYGNHVVEYHYITDFNLTLASAPQSISLYDLLSSESTSFLITYQDENYLYVQDAVVDIWRYYVSESEFISVEHGKTDAGGQTRAHLVTEDVIYKALVWKDGQLLYTSPEFVALCQATPCQINLRQSQTTNGTFSNYENIVYSYSENRTARAVTLTFETTDGTSTSMNMTIMRANQYENETIYSNVVTSSGGSMTASVPISYGNDTYRVLVYKDGEFFGASTFSLKTTAKDIFGNTGIVLSAFAFLILALMGITSGIAVVVLGIIGLALMGMVQIFESGSIFGIGSAIVWLIVAGGIIVYKIVSRRIS